MCQELLEMSENDLNSLNSFWIPSEDKKTEFMESPTAVSRRLKKAHMSKSRIKTMLILFFDIRGIVHHEFLPTNTTVNAAFYLEVWIGGLPDAEGISRTRETS